MHVAVKVVEITTVADNAEPIPAFLVKAKCHAVDSRIHPELTGMHHLRGLRLQNAGIAVPAVLQMGDHEVRHILAADG